MTMAIENSTNSSASAASSQDSSKEKTDKSTPPDEIDRQHEAAVQLVEKGPPCYSKPPTTDEIPIHQKQRPTCELEGDERGGIFTWSSRGQVDVSELQALIRNGHNRSYEPPPTNSSPGRSSASSVDSKSNAPTNFWNPEQAAARNVNLQRPSHDAWGINKILLLMTDDCLLRTYELPWWHGRPEFRSAITPVLRLLGLEGDQQRRVVRLLLASLPPGTTIPHHHDSGLWVTKTHRIHVPILVEHPDRIVFSCGLTADSMERVDCTPGHVFELNNQSKHAVSNCDDQYRVHLILDYMDASFVEALPPRIQLQPGERMMQTRRSMDRWVDRGTRPTPTFMILGAQKAGTTSLYNFINQHPLVVAAKRRETHCLDWRWNETLTMVPKQHAWCLQFYHAQQLQYHPSCLTGDSTPSYLLDSRRVLPRLTTVFPADHVADMKFFVMLRHPVARAVSHYAMVTSDEGTPAQKKTRGTEWRAKSFAQVVLDDWHKMKECGLIPYWSWQEQEDGSITGGVVDRERFDAFVDSPEEDEAWSRYMADIPLHTGSHSLLSRGLYALQLRPWFQCLRRDQFVILQLERHFQGTDAIQESMQRVWKHLKVPAVPLHDTSAKNTRDYEDPLPSVDSGDDTLRDMLERFFAPHNARLEFMLGEEWSGVWSSRT